MTHVRGQHICPGIQLVGLGLRQAPPSAEPGGSLSRLAALSSLELGSALPLDRTFGNCLDSKFSWRRQGGGRDTAGDLSSQTLSRKETHRLLQLSSLQKLSM